MAHASLAKAAKAVSKKTTAGKRALNASDFSPIYETLDTAKSVCRVIENAAAGAALVVRQDNGPPLLDTDYENLAKLIHKLIGEALDRVDELERVGRAQEPGHAH